MLEEAILKVVKEKLPSIQADAISKFVAEANKTKQKLASSQSECERLLEETNRLTKACDVYNTKAKRVKDVEKREKAVAEKEFEVRLMEEKVKFADSKTMMLSCLLSDIFRNTTIRKTVLENSVAVTRHDSDSGYSPDTTPTKTEQEITETPE